MAVQRELSSMSHTCVGLVQWATIKIKLAPLAASDALKVKLLCRRGQRSLATVWVCLECYIHHWALSACICWH